MGPETGVPSKKGQGTRDWVPPRRDMGQETGVPSKKGTGVPSKNGMGQGTGVPSKKGHRTRDWGTLKEGTRDEGLGTSKKGHGTRDWDTVQEGTWHEGLGYPPRMDMEQETGVTPQGGKTITLSIPQMWTVTRERICFRLDILFS